MVFFHVLGATVSKIKDERRGDSIIPLAVSYDTNGAEIVSSHCFNILAVSCFRTCRGLNRHYTTHRHILGYRNTTNRHTLSHYNTTQRHTLSHHNTTSRHIYISTTAHRYTDTLVHRRTNAQRQRYTATIRSCIPTPSTTIAN